MRKKVLAMIVGVAMVAAVLAGCSGSSDQGGSQKPADSGETPAPADDQKAPADSQTAQKDKYKIGLSLEGLDHNYMTVLRDQVLAAAKAYTDAEVEVIVTDGQNDVVTQANGIEDMLTQGIDALLIECSVYEGLESATAAAEAAGVPYFFVGKPAWGTNAVSVVTCDNATIGGECAQWTIDYLTEKYGEAKGNVVQITGIPGDTSSLDRQKGFEEGIAGEEGIKIVTSIDGNYRRDTSYDAMQDALQSNPVGTIDVVYAASGETGIGCYLAAVDAGREGEFAIICIDGDTDTVNYVKDGGITASWTYETCGTYGFNTVMDYLKGEKVEEYTIVPSTRIDADNCDTATPAF